MQRIRDPSRSFWVLLPAVAALGPFAIDMYLSAMPTMAREFHVSDGLIQLSLSTYFLGMAASMLLCGPLSDRWGRRPLLIGGLFLYFIATLGCALAPSAFWLLCFRAIQALGGGAVVLLSRTVYSDFLPVREAARMGALILMIGRIAPLISPWLGGEILSVLGWRWIFACVCVYSALCLAVAYKSFPETLNRAIPSASGRVGALSSYRQLFLDHTFRWSILAAGMPGGVFFGFLAGSPFIYIQHYGLSTRHYGLLMGAMIAGIQIAHLWNRHLLKRHDIAWLALLFSRISVGLLVLMLVLVWSIGSHYLVLAALATAAIAAQSPIQVNTAALQTGRFPDKVGASMALQFSCQNLFGMFGSWAVSKLHVYSGWPEPLPTAIAMACMGVIGLGCAEVAARNRLDHHEAAAPKAP